MAFKNKFLIIISILIGFILALILALFLFLYKPSFFVSFIFGKDAVSLKIKKENNTEKLTTQEFYRLKDIVSRNLAQIKEGIALHPGVLVNVKENTNSTDAYVLSISELEWPFIKVKLEGGITLEKPKQVYKCGNTYLIDFDITGMWIPTVRSGIFTEKGVIVPGIESGKPIILEFYGNCSEISGIVFNEFGDFAGVCSEGTYTPADTITNIDPSTCIPLLKNEVSENNEVPANATIKEESKENKTSESNTTTKASENENRSNILQ